MKTIAVTILLLVAAATARGATGGVDPAHPTRRPDPQLNQEPERRWTAKLRSAVMHSCQSALPDRTNCSCFTHQLEVLSANSEVVTAEGMQAALRMCSET